MIRLSAAVFLLAISAATPALATPWASACQHFYTLSGRTPPAAQVQPDTAALAEHYRRGEAIGFSGGAAVQQGTVILLNQGYGFADWRTGAPMTPETVFDIGSVSKQFTAAAILKLEEQGRLSVEDPISRFFPEAPEDKRAITIHQLLTHTAGLVHTARGALHARGRDEMAAAALAYPLSSTPGERHAYSNSGYALLAAIVEIAAGRSFEAYLNNELWTPAGLRNTGWVLARRTDADFATGYNALGETPTPEPGTWVEDGPNWGRRGQGAILSTMNDLRVWAAALRDGRVLSQASMTKMLTPHVPETPSKASYYGYGWAITASVDGSCTISHNGGNNLHYNVLTFHPEKDLITQAVTVQAFSALRRKVIGRAARILFGGEKSDLPLTAPHSPRRVARIAGVWRAGDGTEIPVIARGSRLIVSSTEPAVARLFTPFPPLSPTDQARIAPAAGQLTLMIDGLAKGDLSALIANLSSRSSPAEEEAYWGKQWAEWVRDHGPYRESRLIGASPQRDELVTWIMIRFERRSIVAAAAHDQDGRVYIGNDIFVAPETEVLPSEYVLAPGSDGVLRVLNASLPGSIEVRVDDDGRRMTVSSPLGTTELHRAMR